MKAKFKNSKTLLISNSSSNSIINNENIRQLKRNLSYNNKNKIALYSKNDISKDNHIQSNKHSLSKTNNNKLRHNSINQINKSQIPLDNNNNLKLKDDHSSSTSSHKKKPFIPTPTSKKRTLKLKKPPAYFHLNEYTPLLTESPLLPPIKRNTSYHHTDKSRYNNNQKHRSSLLYQKAKCMLNNIDISCNTLKNEIKNKKRFSSSSQNQKRPQTVEEQINEDIRKTAQQESLGLFSNNKYIYDQFDCISKVNSNFAANAGNIIDEIFNKKEHYNKQNNIYKNKKLSNIKHKQHGLQLKTNTIIHELNESVKRCYETLNTIN